MSNDIFRQKLFLMDKQFEFKLSEIQTSLAHNGNRGSSAEATMRAFLRNYLPLSNRIGEGEIVDTKGNTTTQLDIIIANENQPYINEIGTPGLYIIEGIDCAGEIKTNLNSNDILTIIKSCKRFKELQINFTGGMSYFNKSDERRFVKRKPYFVFAFKSQMTIETIYKKLISYYQKNNIPIEFQIDGFFCLDRGTIINFGDGKGSFKWLYHNDNTSAKGFVITKNNEEGILLELMTWLSSVIHKIIYYHSPLSKYLL